MSVTPNDGSRGNQHEEAGVSELPASSKRC